MSARFKWSNSNCRRIAESVAADPLVKSRLDAVVQSFQQKNPKVSMGFTGNFKDLSHHTFFELNEIAAGILDAAPDFKELRTTFDRWMTRTTPAAVRPPDEQYAIATLQKYADFMYGLVIGEQNSLEARDMWNATKGYYADLNQQQIPVS